MSLSIIILISICFLFVADKFFQYLKQKKNENKNN